MPNNRASTTTRRSHGLTAANPAMTRAEKIRFNRFREAQLGCLDPRDATEAYLAERIVFHRWLLLKCDQAEAAALRDAVWTEEHPPTRLSDAFVPEMGDLIRSLHDSNRPQNGQPLADHRTVIAFTSDPLENIWRYRLEHERALDRADNRFQAYRRSRILIGLPTDSSRAASEPRHSCRAAHARPPSHPGPSAAPTADPVTAPPRKLSKPRCSTKPNAAKSRASRFQQKSYGRPTTPADPPKSPRNVPNSAQMRGGRTDSRPIPSPAPFSVPDSPFSIPRVRTERRLQTPPRVIPAHPAQPWYGCASGEPHVAGPTGWWSCPRNAQPVASRIQRSPGSVGAVVTGWTHRPPTVPLENASAPGPRRKYGSFCVLARWPGCSRASGVPEPGSTAEADRWLR